MAEEGETKEPKASSSREAESEGRDSESGSLSSRSDTTMDSKEPEPEAKQNSGRRGTRKMAKKVDRKRRLDGRVKKRKTSRRSKRKLRSKLPRTRMHSTSTVYTVRRSDSAAGMICKYCGHSSCGRRYSYKRRRDQKRQRSNTEMPVDRTKPVSMAAQAGSRAAMLSPLFVKGNSVEQTPTTPEHCQITPQMIIEVLKKLTKLREGVPTAAIFDFIRYSYPVNSNPEELMDDLIEKLEVASIARLIWALPNDCWRLTSAIERINKLEQSHVTIFWRVYVDTLKPLDAKRRRIDNAADTNSSGQQQEDDGDIV